MFQHKQLLKHICASGKNIPSLLHKNNEKDSICRTGGWTLHIREDRQSSNTNNNNEEYLVLCNLMNQE